MKFYEMENENDAAAEVIRKIKAKEEFSEDELSKLRWYFGETDDWEEGLTELQENEFYDQPYFVEPKEETIVVTRWEKINND